MKLFYRHVAIYLASLIFVPVCLVLTILFFETHRPQPDLNARMFGALLGGAYAVMFAAVGFALTLLLARSIFRRLLALHQEVRESLEKLMENATEAEKELARAKNPPPRLLNDFGCLSPWAAWGLYLFECFVTAVIWTAVACFIAYAAGMAIDQDYALAEHAHACGITDFDTPLTWRFVRILAIFSPAYLAWRAFRVCRKTRHPIMMSINALHQVVRLALVLTCGVGIVHGTVRLACPALRPVPVALQDGIYIYANDTVYNLAPLNVYSSRMKGFTHTGICLLTRAPEEVNAWRKARGWKTLRFEELDGGYYINDLNLDIADRDGLANHGSRTSLSDISFPFDVAGFNHYLAGRSVNDRLKPAVMLARVEIEHPRLAWQDVIRFRDDFNERYPQGFIYSPIPYRAKYASLYNCNTVIAAVAGEILHQGDKYDFLTDIPMCFGGQTAADGKRMLDDLMTTDRREDIARQRAFMQTAPQAEQSFYHRLLQRNGWLHGCAGDLREE